MNDPRRLTYGRVTAHPRGTRLRAYEKKYGGEVCACAACGASIVVSGTRDTMLCRSLYGVDSLPDVCLECNAILRQCWLDSMMGRTLFYVGLLARTPDNELPAPEMIS